MGDPRAAVEASRQVREARLWAQARQDPEFLRVWIDGDGRPRVFSGLAASARPKPPTVTLPPLVQFRSLAS